MRSSRRRVWSANMTQPSNYDKFPYISVSPSSSICHVGWAAIANALQESLPAVNSVVSIECYPGVLAKHLDDLVRLLRPASVTRTETLFKSSDCIHQMVAQF